jgi:hypothetical protein
LFDNSYQLTSLFSTSKDPGIVVVLADGTDAYVDKQRVIFEIDANYDFDDISQLSYIQDGQKVIIMPRTIFWIDNIHFAENRLRNIHTILRSNNDRVEIDYRSYDKRR